MACIITLVVIIALLLLVGLIYDLRQRGRGTSTKILDVGVRQARDDARQRAGLPPEPGPGVGGL